MKLLVTGGAGFIGSAVVRLAEVRGMITLGDPDLLAVYIGAALKGLGYRMREYADGGRFDGAGELFVWRHAYRHRW